MNKMMSAADPKLKTNFRLEFRNGSCVKVFFAKQQQTLHRNLYQQFCKIKETIFLSFVAIFVGSFLAWALTVENSWDKFLLLSPQKQYRTHAACCLLLNEGKSFATIGNCVWQSLLIAMEAAFVFVESHLWQIPHTLVTLHKLHYGNTRLLQKLGLHICAPWMSQGSLP